MILSDADIERRYIHPSESERLEITPFHPDKVQPASYDVSLGDQFRYFRKGAHVAIDPLQRSEDLTKMRTLRPEQQYILHPGDFVLGKTLEYFKIPTDLAARVEGKSSLGRIGLVIHATAGWIDPGFEGNITLELANNAPLPIVLTPYMLIGQIAFMKLSSAAERPYGSPGLGSKYQGHTEPTEGHVVAGYPVRNDYELGESRNFAGGMENATQGWSSQSTTSNEEEVRQEEG